MIHTLSGLAYKRIADIPTGNLFYVVDNQGDARLALRVEHATAQAPLPAYLKFFGEANGIQFAELKGGGNIRGIILGKPVWAWSPPLKMFQEQPTAGALLLHGNAVLLPSFYGDGRNMLLWDIDSGKSVDLDDQTPKIWIGEWSLGLKDVEGNFNSLIRYPKA